ncbi:MAG: porin [Rickettsiaceae bacterium]
MRKKVIRCAISVANVSVLLFVTPTAFALDNMVKIGAVMDVAGIYYKTNGDATQQKLSTHQRHYGLYSSGHFLVDYQLSDDSGWKYGTKISIQQTTRNDRGAPFSIYTETSYGKVEAGSDKSAEAKMVITGYKTSCASGNGWDSYVIASPKDGKEAKVPYITNFCNFLDAKTRTSMLSDYSRKITYYTPKFGSESHKLQVGLSYIPDTSNAGHGDVDAVNLHGVVGASKYKFAFKDGIAYGLVYEGKMSDTLSAKIAFVGEKGKTVAFNKADSTKTDIKFKNLNTYNIGTEVIYGQFSVSGSYMNYNKSVTNNVIDKLGRNTSIYSVGAKYKFMEGKYAVSVNHFHSNNKNNKLDAESIGIDYFITSGIKAHAQVTYFGAKGRYQEDTVIKNDRSKGTVTIIGAKVSL